MQNDRSYDWICRMRNWVKFQALHVINDFQMTYCSHWNVECKMRRGQTRPGMEMFDTTCRCRMWNGNEVGLDMEKEIYMLVES